MNTPNEDFPIGGIKPHGEELANRVLTGEIREEALDRAQTLRRLQLESMLSRSDLELLATGTFSPLNGFMVKEDYDRVVQEMRLNAAIRCFTVSERAVLTKTQMLRRFSDDLSNAGCPFSPP